MYEDYPRPRKTEVELFRAPYMLDVSLFADPWYGIPLLGQLTHMAGELAAREVVFLPTLLTRLGREHEDVLRRILIEYGGAKKTELSSWYIRRLISSLSECQAIAFTKQIDPIEDYIVFRERYIGMIVHALKDLGCRRDYIEFFTRGIEELHPYIANILLEEIYFLLRHSSVVTAKGRFIDYLKKLGFFIMQVPEKYKRFVDAKNEFFERVRLRYFKPIISMCSVLLTSSLPIHEQIIIAVLFDP